MASEGQGAQVNLRISIFFLAPKKKNSISSEGRQAYFFFFSRLSRWKNFGRAVGAAPSPWAPPLAPSPSEASLQGLSAPCLQPLPSTVGVGIQGLSAPCPQPLPSTVRVGIQGLSAPWLQPLPSKVERSPQAPPNLTVKNHSHKAKQDEIHVRIRV